MEASLNVGYIRIVSSLPADAEIASRHEGDGPAVVTLKGRHVVDGIACVQMIHLHDNGRLAYCIIDEPTKVGDFDLAPGDALYLRPEGAPERIRFQQPRIVAGHAGVQSVGFSDSGEVEEMEIGDMTIDPYGIVRRRRLVAATTIAGIACTGLTLFDSEGRLTNTILADDLLTPHGTIPAGSRVSFHADGSVDRAQLGSACVLAGQRFERNDPARFSLDTVKREGWLFYTASLEHGDPRSR
jgi:hypothetical protein